MIDAAQKACEFMQGKTKNDLESDELLSLAIVRLIEIIGEAASKISKQKQEQYPEIAWSEIIGMRNRIVHAYFDINTAVVWRTIIEDLPILVTQLNVVLTREGIQP
jgi:uncharacterized protein with HEPN domain